jgi:hypothetical protein
LRCLEFKRAQITRCPRSRHGIGIFSDFATHAGETGFDQQSIEPPRSLLHDAVESFAATCTGRNLPARNYAKWLREKVGRSFLCQGSRTKDGGRAGAKVSRLFGDAIMVGVIGFGGIDEIEADDCGLSPDFDVKAVAVEILVLLEAAMIPRLPNAGLAGVRHASAEQERDNERNPPSVWHNRSD